MTNRPLIRMISPELRPRLLKSLSVGLLVVFVALGICQIEHLRHQPFGTDHFVYSVALEKAWLGQDPYLRTPSGWAYLYPPPSFLLLKAVEIITPSGTRSAITFVVLSFAAAVLGLRLLMGPLTWKRQLVAALLLTSAGFIETIYLGQINGIVIGFVSVFLYAWRRQSYWLACFALAAAICLKITPLVLALLLLTRAHWRWLVVLAGFVGAWHAVAQLLIPVPHLTRSFIDTLWWASHQLNYGLFGIMNNYSLSMTATAFLHDHFGVDLERAVVHRDKLIILAALFALTYALYLARGRTRGATNTLFVQCTLCAFLAPNIVWLHHATLLIPGLWVLLMDIQSPFLSALCVAALLCFQCARCLYSLFGVLPRGPFLTGEVLLLMAGVLLPLSTGRCATESNGEL